MLKRLSRTLAHGMALSSDSTTRSVVHTRGKDGCPAVHPRVVDLLSLFQLAVVLRPRFGQEFQALVHDHRNRLSAAHGEQVEEQGRPCPFLHPGFGDQPRCDLVAGRLEPALFVRDVDVPPNKLILKVIPDALGSCRFKSCRPCPADRAKKPRIAGLTCALRLALRSPLEASSSPPLRRRSAKGSAGSRCTSPRVTDGRRREPATSVRLARGQTAAEGGTTRRWWARQSRLETVRSGSSTTSARTTHGSAAASGHGRPCASPW